MKLLSDYPKTPLVTLAAPIACFGISLTHAQTTTDPLAGTWGWTLFSGKCAEKLEYQADGILLSTSGAAVTYRSGLIKFERLLSFLLQV